MDRNQKFLKLLNEKEFDSVQSVLRAIVSGDTSTLISKKLSGYPNLYRIRVGSIRVIYVVHSDYNEILFVGRRNEKTYKKF
tara:strand:+ start:3830 stop:4072 length:243 start_codon:yes stop_codon:yes gene_type:complete